MLREILANRTVQASVVFIVLMGVGSLIYLWHVERENAWSVAETAAVARRYEKILERAPQDTAARKPNSDAVGGHWHGDEWHADAHPPNSDGEPQAAQGLSPPADYHGNPVYWIPGIEYETLGTSHGVPLSFPRISPEKLERLMDVTDLQYREETKHLTLDQRNQLRVEIHVEGMNALDAAKFLISTGYEKYARDYAEKAIVENPDNFDAHLILGDVLPFNEREPWFRRLVDWKPNSVPALVTLGAMVRDDREAIGYLERAAQLSPTYLLGYAFFQLGERYQKIGDYDAALAALKQARAIHPGDEPQSDAYIEAIEKGDPLILKGGIYR